MKRQDKQINKINLFKCLIEWLTTTTKKTNRKNLHNAKYFRKFK